MALCRVAPSGFSGSQKKRKVNSQKSSQIKTPRRDLKEAISRAIDDGLVQTTGGSRLGLMWIIVGRKRPSGVDESPADSV